MRPARIFASVLVVPSCLTACGTAFIGTRITDPATADKPALHYHLPVDVVEVVVTLERSTTTAIVKEDGKDPAPVTSPPKVKATGATINLQTIADTARSFVLDANATGFSKNNTALTVTETGLLQSVNAKMSGSGGVVFENVMKIAGSVLPFFIGGKVSPSVANNLSLDSLDSNPFKAFQKRGQFFVASADLNVVSSRTTCDESIVRTDYLPKTHDYDYAFTELPSKADLIRNFCKTLEARDVRWQSYQGALMELDDEQDVKRIKALDGKVKRLHQEYSDTLALHAAARQSLVDALDQVIKEAGVGTKTETYTQRFVLRLDSLPRRASVEAEGSKLKDPEALSDDVRKMFTSAYGTSSQNQTSAGPNTASQKPADQNAPSGSVAGGTQLPAKSASSSGQDSIRTPSDDAERLFLETGILVSAEPLGAVQAAKDGDNGEVACKQPKNSEPPCVFYRSPRPYLLASWTTQEETDPKLPDQRKRRLVQSDSRIVDAISEKSPILAIELRDSKFTKRDSTLAFSPRGRLTGLTRDYGSAAEDASSAVASGLANGLTTYQTTLTGIKTIRATENEIQLQPLQQQLALANAKSAIELQPIQAQVQTAQQQLALLNGQLQLQSTTQGKDAILATQLANIQNSLTSAQSQLATSQAALIATATNAAQTQAEADLKASSSLLAAEISQLQNEIQLLKLKQQIEDLKKTSEEPAN